MKQGIEYRKYENSDNIFLILISFFGLFLLMNMFIWAQLTSTIYSHQDPIILSIFILICILGMVAAVKPVVCKGLVTFQQGGNRDENKSRPKVIFEGHHPKCPYYESHTFHIKGKKYCPGCSGLFLGALIAIIGSILYFLESYAFIYSQNYFWIGTFMVLLSLTLLIFLNIGKRLKFISNLMLVLGSFLTLIGILNQGNNLLIEIYFIILVFFWIITRIRVSETSHELICVNCQKNSICIYE